MSTPTTRPERLARHHALSSRLAALDDDAVVDLLETTSFTAVGIGGTTASLRVDDVPVFVKSVPLTELEQRPEHVGSTRNLFDLPLHYQYGFGSHGFGAWRDLAVHRMAGRWVLDGRFDGFPLLYHWRILPRRAVPPMNPGELDEWVARWEGSSRIRARLTAISESTASVVLFLEHLPYTVDAWLAQQAQLGAHAAEAAYDLVERDLRAGADFLAAERLVHFDAHFHNLLTDGERIYYADFGLSLHAGFDLTEAEADFFHLHRNYDRGYTITYLTHWIVARTLGLPWWDCHEYLRDNLGNGWPELPPHVARRVTRNAPVALAMGGFLHQLRDRRSVPYPAEELDRIIDRYSG